jgi:hypothetical protein
MSLGTEAASSGEIIASAPGDIQVIVYGEAFPAKKLKKDAAPLPRTDIIRLACAGCDGCIEIGDWLTEEQRREFRKLMSFPGDNPATVFQIVVNVPPVRRLICEWPHGSSDEGDTYHFTQLADLDNNDY